MKKTPDEVLARIRNALKELRLSEMAAQLEDELSKGSRAGEGRLEFVWRLVERQLIARRERSVAWRLRHAQLPAPKTFDEFDFAFQPKLDRERVLELATLDFIRRGENLLVAGILDRLIEHGHLLTIEGPSWRGHQHEKLNARSTDKEPAPVPKKARDRKNPSKPRPRRR